MAYGDNKTKEELIDEIYGLGFSPNMSHLHTKLDDPWKSSGLKRNLNQPDRSPSPDHKCGHQMGNWQIQVYQMMLQGMDAIVAVPPAAGKTLPIICAWKQKLIEGLRKPQTPYMKGGENFPRIAFVVPTQQLAMQIGKQDFLRDSNSGLLKMFSETPELFQKFFGKKKPIYRSIQGRKFEEKTDPRTGQQIMYYDVSPLVNIKSGRIITNPGEIKDDRDVVPLFKINNRNQIEPNLNPRTKAPFIDSNTGRPYDLNKYYEIAMKETNMQLTSRDISELFKMLDRNFIGVLAGPEKASVATTDGLFTPIKPIIVGTYKPMEKVITQYGKYFDAIIIDETQEFLGRPGENFIGKNTSDKQEAFVKIIKAVPPKTSLFLLTGSTNGQTLKDIKDLFNQTQNRRMRLIMPNLPPSQRNRSPINIMPFEKMQTFTQLKEICTNVVTTRQTNSIMLLFSLKRTAQTGILRIMEDIIPKLPIINKEYYDNKGQFLKGKPNSEKLRIINDRILRTEEFIRSLNDDDEDYENKRKNALQRLKILNKLKEQGITTKITVKDRGGISIGISNVDDYDKYISQLGKPVTPGQLVDIHSSDFVNSDPPEQIGTIGKEFSDLDDIEFLKYFDIKALEDSGKRNHVLTSPDSNNLLYQGVLRGMGIMTGSMHQRHKETIQKLFKTGKIPLLFATDALGVGANVKCKYLYIPKLLKFQDGGGFGPIDPSSLVQLVNRAGRKGPDFVAYVYCNPADFEEVKTMIKGDPTITVDQVSDVPFGSLVDFVKQKGDKEGLKQTLNLLSNNG